MNIQKLSRLAIALFAGTALSLTACKKDSSSPSRHDSLVGNWQEKEEGEDTNGNGTWDAGEHIAVAAADAFNAQFNGDGSGSETGTFQGLPITIPFTWVLQNSDNDMRIISNFAGSMDTTIQNIVTVSSSELIFKDASSSPASYTRFTK